MLMCGGDGLADILGRRITPRPLPWNASKTWAGSAGMLVGGWFFAALVMAVFVAAGVFAGALVDYLGAITLIAVAGALVESLPVHNIDNITVTLTAVILGHILF
jgi:dolichol kinase